ncbi:glutamate receptor 2-like [Anoplophora glabripennis]|uniref:glutamate receptor 2-like n=1 Tax=Anoplophora glabripennis TaxID=217634 RepID=UPI0008756A17|nr:glutamate receptor 2-like [Anoplophora glabripennis]
MQMMQLSRLIAVLYFVLVISVSGFLDCEIIEGYIKKRFINHVTIIGCFSKKEQLKIVKKLTSKLMTSVLNLNKTNIHQTLETTLHLGVILDGDCNGVKHFLSMGGKHKYFDEKHHWLVLTSTTNFTHLFDNVEIYINGNIEIIYPEKNVSSVKNYTIQAVYNPSSSQGGYVKFYTVGFYNTMEGYTFGETYPKYSLRRNMTGVRLKTMVVLPIPFKGKLLDYLDNEENRDINTFNRYQYNLMSLCQRFYNFTKEVTISTTWGYKKEDGSFDGLVGALERKQVDYGSSPIFVRTDRAKVVQYGRKTWTLGAAFIFRNPKSLSSIEGFIKPLSSSIWALTAVSAVLLIILLRLSCVYEHQNIYQHVDMSWSYFVVCIIGALCQQGMSITPKFLSGRIVTLFLFLFALLIYQFYSASLVSNLLMEPPTKIKSLDDITRSNLKVGCEDIVYNREYFLNTIDKPSRKLYFQKLLGPNNNSHFLPPEKGLELVAKGQYAFHVETTIAYPIIRKTFKEDAICELRQIEMHRVQSLHTNFQKNSPYKEMFDICLQHLAEVGIMTREITFWRAAKPDCIRSSKTGAFNIGLDEFYPALALLGFGIACSVVILLFEMLFFYKQRCEEKQKEVLTYPFIK